MTPSLGVTGGTGVGKSTVAEAFARRGALILDADAIGHEVLRQDDTIHALAGRFGEEILAGDGSVNRGALGGKVFGDREALDDLNSIVHPPLLRLLRERLDAARGDTDLPLVVVDAALITEWGIEDWFDEVVVVTAPREVVRERLRGKGLSEEQIARRIASQLPDTDRIARANGTIVNDGDVDALEREVERVWKGLVDACGSS